jgi:hypothetical protein
MNGTNPCPTGFGAHVFHHLQDDVSMQSHGFSEVLRVPEKYTSPRTALRILDVG